LEYEVYYPSSKIGVHVPARFALTALKQSRGELQKRILKEVFREMFCGMGFSRNHKHFEEFNRRIVQLIEAGIIGHFRDEFKKYFDSKFYEKPQLIHNKYLETTWRKSFVDEPQILTMKDLKAGFVIWLYSLCLPIIAFVIEWIVRLKDFLVFKFILKAFFEVKQSNARNVLKCKKAAICNNNTEMKISANLREIESEEKLLNLNQNTVLITKKDKISDKSRVELDNHVLLEIYADLNDKEIKTS
jgi:hypothetical protein